MTGVELAATLATALVVGLLIGAVGVGGVLLAPWLTQGIGMPVAQAAAIAMLAFVGPGLVAAHGLWRSRRRLPRAWLALLAATVPGALAGAAALRLVPERIALGVLAVAVSVVGWRLLATPAASAGSAAVRSADGAAAARPRAATIGAVIGTLGGFASAITATSGPMVITPWMLSRGVALLDAIAVGQLAQLPIALTATAGHLLAGPVDVATGVLIGAVLVPGSALGQRLAPRLPRRLLARLVGAMLLAAAVLFVAKAW